MPREEGTYILLVDVFKGQDTLFFPLSYHDGEAYLLGVDENYNASLDYPISDFGFINYYCPLNMPSPCPTSLLPVVGHIYVL